MKIKPLLMLFSLRKQDQQRRGPIKRKARKAKGIIIDEEQTVIPNHVYHSWLHDTSDIISRRGRKKRVCLAYLQYIPFILSIIMLQYPDYLVSWLATNLHHEHISNTLFWTTHIKELMRSKSFILRKQSFQESLM